LLQANHCYKPTNALNILNGNYISVSSAFFLLTKMLTKWKRRENIKNHTFLCDALDTFLPHFFRNSIYVIQKAKEDLVFTLTFVLHITPIYNKAPTDMLMHYYRQYIIFVFKMLNIRYNH